MVTRVEKWPTNLVFGGNVLSLTVPHFLGEGPPNPVFWRGGAPYTTVGPNFLGGGAALAPLVPARLAGLSATSLKRRGEGWDPPLGVVVHRVAEKRSGMRNQPFLSLKSGITLFFEIWSSKSPFAQKRSPISRF